MTSAKRILDVGQCGVDGPRIARFLTREFHSIVDHADSRDEALSFAAAHYYDLALVNRILARDGTEGIEVISALRNQNPDLRVMLISDYPEAQQQATKLGALAGFGKRNLDSDETEEMLRTVLNA